jgi:RNA polymerase sigma-70 factor (ECF subfamily)
LINEVNISNKKHLEKEKIQKEQVHELQNLIKSCLQKDRSAQEKFYKKYFGLLMGIAQRYFINKDDSLDAVNRAFLKVFKSLSKYRFEGAFEGFISTICVRVILDILRTQKWEAKRETIVEKASSKSILPNLYYQDLLQLLNRLPESTKVVFNLFAIEGFKHQEIAKQLNISEGICVVDCGSFIELVTVPHSASKSHISTNPSSA